MHQRLSRSNWPYCDSTYPDAFSGEKILVELAFIASVEGTKSLGLISGITWSQLHGAQRRMRGDSDSGDGAGIYVKFHGHI